MEILKTRPLPNSTNGWMITEWMTLHFFLSLSLSLSLKNKTIPFLNGEGPIYIGSAFLSIKGEGGGGIVWWRLEDTCSIKSLLDLLGE